MLKSVKITNFKLFGEGLDAVRLAPITRTCSADLIPWQHSNAEAYQRDEKTVRSLTILRKRIEC